MQRRLLQIADNGLSQIRTILDSLVDLTKTANGTGLTITQYKLLDGQFQQQKNLIDSIVSHSTYNGANLLDGTLTATGTANFQISGTLPIAIPSVTSASLFGTPTSLGSPAHATAATITVGNAKDSVNNAIAIVAAYQVRLDAAENATRSSIQGIRNATNDLLHTDTASESQTLAADRIKQHTAAAIFAQALGVNANLLSLIH